MSYLSDQLREHGPAFGLTHLCDEAADALDANDARIAELEAQLATVAPAVDAQPVAIQAGDDVTVTNVPARIYLNLGDTYEMGEIPFQSLTDVTWCEDHIDDTDIEYVRAGASAQSEGLRKDAWQPIETAPKDGRMFLVWVEAARFGEDDDGQPFEQDCSTADFAEWHKCGDDGYINYFAHPFADREYATHWQPLPAPPAALSQHTGEQS